MKEKNCCKVEALVSIDERGQIVLPKDLREKLAIKGGDKLALFSWEKNNQVCCISLVKAENLNEGFKEFLGPVVADIFQNNQP